MGQILRLVEHVLAEDAGVKAGHRDRTGVMKTPGLDLAGQLQRIARAADVRLDLAFSIGGKIVDGRQVEEVLDLPGQCPPLSRADAEQGLRQVAADCVQPLAVISEAHAQFVELLLRPLAHQAIHLALAREQFEQQMAANEPCRPRHEIRHVFPLSPARVAAGRR
jgi:hypothetical protein